MPSSKRVRQVDSSEEDDERECRGTEELWRGAAPCAPAKGRAVGGAGRPAGLSQESAQQYQMFRALDHALRLSGNGGCRSWLPLPEVYRLLGPIEIRYMHTCDAPWAGYDAKVWKRSCVKDMQTGAKRFEVAVRAAEHGGPALGIFADEHGVQLSTLQKAMAKLKLRWQW